MRMYRRGAQSRVSRKHPTNIRKATTTECYEHARWRRRRSGEKINFQFREWSISDRINLTISLYIICPSLHGSRGSRGVEYSYDHKKQPTTSTNNHSSPLHSNERGGDRGQESLRDFFTRSRGLGKGCSVGGGYTNHHHLHYSTPSAH